MRQVSVIVFTVFSLLSGYCHSLGEIRGKVLDERNLPVPQARVILVSDAPKIKRGPLISTDADEYGNFKSSNVPLGPISCVRDEGRCWFPEYLLLFL